MHISTPVKRLNTNFWSLLKSWITMLIRYHHLMMPMWKIKTFPQYTIQSHRLVMAHDIWATVKSGSNENHTQNIPVLIRTTLYCICKKITSLTGCQSRVIAFLKLIQLRGFYNLVLRQLYSHDSHCRNNHIHTILCTNIYIYIYNMIIQ